MDIMLAPWALEEMRTVDLRDKRLDERVTRILSDLGQRPTASIPAACGGHAEVTAAYRFFDNDKATPLRILQPHYDRTMQRIADNSVALLVQDTTELDVTRPEAQVKGTGSLDGSSRRGVFLHLMEAFTEDGTPLGAVWAEMWSRPDEQVPLSQKEKQKRRKETPIEDKESYRWLEGLRRARAVAEASPTTTCISVADSEADIYELFAEPRGTERPVQWLIRACYDRALEKTPDQQGELQQQAAHLRTAAMAAAVVGTQEIIVRGRVPKTGCEKRARRQPRTSRDAIAEVRATTVTLNPPRRPDRKFAPVTVNVVLVREINPPKGEDPVEWILVTTLSIDTKNDVMKIIQYYKVRWMIEVIFRTLKSGCCVEDRRFEHVDRLLPCVAIYVIVAWRTLMVCRMGRSCPDIDCEAIFEPGEWKAVYTVVKNEAPPKKPPRLEEIVRLVGQLGGWVNRPNRTDLPGVQTIWLGLQRMHDLAWAWARFGPEAVPRDV
jgi:Transposase DNA-binding/Transposase Tn5 dimerisation domain/Transposase DDE domain